MTAIKQSGLAAATAVVLAVQAIHGMAQQNGAKKAEPMAQSSVADKTTRTIVVSLEDHKLALIEDGQVKKVYPVAVGKPSTPSPAGTFTIERRVMNPTYSHNGRIVPPGPGNPVGTRWMGLSIKGYGIHGTNEPKSIGKAASHGCIRMARADIEELYGLVEVGDTVELVGQGDEETARLFRNGQNPASPVAVNLTQTARAEAPAATRDAKRAQSATAAIGLDATAITTIAGTI